MARPKAKAKKTVVKSGAGRLVICRVDSGADDGLFLKPVESLDRRSHQTAESALSEWVKALGVDTNAYVAVSILTPKQRRVVKEVSTVESENMSIAVGQPGLVK